MTDDVVVVDPVQDPVNLKTWLFDTLERVAVTFLIAVVTLVTITGVSDFDLSMASQLATAGLVAAATALSTATLPKRGFGLTPLVDVVSRAAWSAVQGGASVIAADAGFQWYNATAWEVVGVSALMAGVSVVKGYLSTRMTTDTVTPASLAPK